MGLVDELLNLSLQLYHLCLHGALSVATGGVSRPEPLLLQLVELECTVVVGTGGVTRPVVEVLVAPVGSPARFTAASESRDRTAAPLPCRSALWARLGELDYECTMGFYFGSATRCARPLSTWS